MNHDRWSDAQFQLTPFSGNLESESEPESSIFLLLESEPELESSHWPGVGAGVKHFLYLESEPESTPAQAKMCDSDSGLGVKPGVDSISWLTGVRVGTGVNFFLTTGVWTGVGVSFFLYSGVGTGVGTGVGVKSLAWSRSRNRSRDWLESPIFDGKTVPFWKAAPKRCPKRYLFTDDQMVPQGHHFGATYFFDGGGSPNNADQPCLKW